MRIQFGQITESMVRRGNRFANFPQDILKRRYLFEGHSESDQIAGVAIAGAQTANGSLQITHMRELGAEMFEREGIVEEGLDRLLAFANCFHHGERLRKPVPQAPCAHGSYSAIHRAEETGGSRRVMLQRFENLEMAQRREVECEEIVELVK